MEFYLVITGCFCATFVAGMAVYRWAYKYQLDKKYRKRVEEHRRELKRDEDGWKELRTKQALENLSEFIETFHSNNDTFLKEKLCITDIELLKIKMQIVGVFEKDVIIRFYQVLGKCTKLPDHYLLSY